MNKDKGFSLTWVLIIVTITSIISGLTAGVIVYNNNKLSNSVTLGDLSKDDALNEFLKVYANISTEYYEDVDKSKMLEKAIAAMMDYLGDDYTDYLNDKTTADLMEKLNGKYTGIGVSINNETKEITEVFEDSPAFKAGILKGDIIIGVNDKDVSMISTSAIVDIIKKCTNSFSLKLSRNNEIVSVTLKNEEITSPSINYHMIEGTQIGYLGISTFSATLDDQVTKALNKLEKGGMTSLIIDVRNNTGGFLDSAVSVASKFIEKDKAIYSLSNKSEVETFYDDSNEHKDYKVIILINEDTASASEILAAALKQSYGATLVGKKTFGKGKVQQTMKLEDGSMVKYTSAYWLMPDGKCLDKVGLNPDYEIDNETVLDENRVIKEIIDNQLTKAIELLK